MNHNLIWPLAATFMAGLLVGHFGPPLVGSGATGQISSSLDRTEGVARTEKSIAQSGGGESRLSGSDGDMTESGTASLSPLPAGSEATAQQGSLFAWNPDEPPPSQPPPHLEDPSFDGLFTNIEEAEARKRDLEEIIAAMTRDGLPEAEIAAMREALQADLDLASPEETVQEPAIELTQDEMEDEMAASYAGAGASPEVIEDMISELRQVARDLAEEADEALYEEPEEIPEE